MLTTHATMATLQPPLTLGPKHQALILRLLQHTLAVSMQRLIGSNMQTMQGRDPSSTPCHGRHHFGLNAREVLVDFMYHAVNL